MTIRRPSVSTIDTEKPDLNVVGGRAMMKLVATSSLRVTPCSPQSKVTEAVASAPIETTGALPSTKAVTDTVPAIGSEA